MICQTLCKLFFIFFGLVVYLLSACKWEDYCMIRQLTSKPICFTKICNHFWFAKHFVKSFLIFLRSFFSTLKSSPGGTRTHNHMDCGLNAACIPISPPNHFTNMSKNLCLLFHKDINLFWNHKTIKHKKPLFFGEGF